MRQIVFLKLGLNDPILWELLLDFCSKYTPLLEPLAEDLSLYLDLSGCGDAPSIIQAVSSFVRLHSRQAQIRAGLGASRLLAHLAIRSSLHCCPTGSYQLVSAPGLLLVTVPAGCEKNFIDNLPLADLSSLSGQAVKKLSRLGFSTIGELAYLSTEQLSQLNIENPQLLMQHINGIDPSPVAGLYPPSRIIYPLPGDKNLDDRFSIESLLKDAASRLERLLEDRHSACRHISLQIRSETETLLKKRQLSSYCYRADQLLNIFIALFPWKYMREKDWDLQIILQDLTSLSFCQPDLFRCRIFFNKWEQGRQLEELIQNLQKRFPGHLKQGLDINRRERILAFWDPWRKGLAPTPGS